MNNSVLIIEFNDDLRDNACEILQLCKYSVLSANNGLVGYDMVKTHKPDCIVCDLLSPDSHGETFMHLINSDDANRRTPVVVASSLDAAPHPFNQLNPVMLRKPYTGSELVAKVKQAMYSK